MAAFRKENNLTFSAEVRQSQPYYSVNQGSLSKRVKLPFRVKEVKDKNSRAEDEMTKILIVGKDPSVREFMAEELAGEGHLVVTTGNPALIEELISTLEPELMLLDFNLSRMDLWNTMERLKKRGPRLPVLTFNSYNGGKEEIRLEMADGYGIQRFSLETLKQKIAELLRLKPIRGWEWVKEDLLVPQAYIPSTEAKGQKAHRQSRT